MDQQALTQALAALGHPIRMSLYRRLVATGDAGSGPVALAAAQGIQQNLVSYHLQPLLAAGLVRNERRGREVIYKALPAGITRLATGLLNLLAVDAEERAQADGLANL